MEQVEQNKVGQRRKKSHPKVIKAKGDLRDRISTRAEDELMIDILLSGTAATLLIQTPKKIYIGYIGDSLVALQGSEKNVHQ